MEFLKTIGGKIATGMVGLMVVAAGISWWQTDPQTRQSVMSISGRLAGWGVIVLALPWAAFWFIGWVARLQSNVAGAMFVFVLTAIEAMVLMWLFGWSIHGSTARVLFAAGVIVSAVYNLFTSDWIAEKVE